MFLILIVLLLFPAGSHAETYHVRTSSFSPVQDETVFDRNVLTDGNYTSGWIEKGDGRGTGEWIHFFFPAKVIVDSVTIRNGIGTGDEFKNINRVKDVIISYSEGQRQGFTLQDIEKLQSPRVKSYPTTSLGISIHSVYSEGGSEETGLSEIAIKYHRPAAEELEAIAKAQSVATAAQGIAGKPRKLTAKEKKVLYEKMDKLEKKKFVLNELKQFFDKFYTNFVTINEDYPRMYVEEHFLRESAMFESFRSMLETRGVLQKYNEAVVSTAGLRYNIRTLTPTEVELWVKGEYTVIYNMRSNQVHENALYHLKKEYGEWKVKNKLEY